MIDADMLTTHFLFKLQMMLQHMESISLHPVILNQHGQIMKYFLVVNIFRFLVLVDIFNLSFNHFKSESV